MEQYNNSLLDMSRGPGLYRLEDSKLRNKISYPWATNVRIQNMGGSVFGENFIDVKSKLDRLDYPLSKNPELQYSPLDENLSNEMIHFEDGGPPEQENTYLTNNPFELKGVGINRFEILQIDTQKNAIEPFRRIGENTVLVTLDRHVQECKY